MTHDTRHGVRISEALYHEIVAHCQQEYPKEACGLLVANATGAVERITRMTNVEHSPIGYQMDPKEQLRVMKQMRQQAQTMAGIYHSHTASAAYPSPVDVSLAVYPEVSYVLVSLQDQARPDVRSYRIVDGTITQEDLQIGE